MCVGLRRGEVSIQRRRVYSNVNNETMLFSLRAYDYLRFLDHLDHENESIKFCGFAPLPHRSAVKS